MSIDFISSLNSFSLSVAVMVVFFILEYFVSLVVKKKVFDFPDTIANTACGIIERGIYIVFAFAYFGAFEYVFDNYRLFTIPQTWWSTILLFLAIDFMWYIYHRSGHVINILWAAHITHHQSEQYNLTLSFRVSSLQLFIRTFFWMVLPFLGFDPLETTVLIGINAAYQFFIHTRLIDKMGFLEHIIVTPSHHRVHHGKNPQYIDKNYGGILIIWDKLFGTFQKEEEEVQYGITKPLNSYNPMVAWFHYFRDLWGASKMEKGFANKVKIFFAGPETLADYYDEIGEKPFRPNPLTSNLKWYIGIQFAFLCFICITMFYWYGPDNFLQNLEMTAIIFFVLFSSLSFSTVLENKKGGFVMELIRVLITGALLFGMSFTFEQELFKYLSVVYTVVFYIWLFKLKPALRVDSESESKVGALNLQKQ